MSLGALAKAELRQGSAPVLERGLEGIGTESGAPPPADQAPSASMIEALVEYIPTETVTLYLAALAAQNGLATIFEWLTPVALYFGFAIATPVLFFLILFGDRRQLGQPVLPKLSEWPLWRPIAATIAFLIWALAIPGHPWTVNPAAQTVAALGALVVSALLRLVGRVVEPARQGA